MEHWKYANNAVFQFNYVSFESVSFVSILMHKRAENFSFFLLSMTTTITVKTIISLRLEHNSEFWSKCGQCKTYLTWQFNVFYVNSQSWLLGDGGGAFVKTLANKGMVLTKTQNWYRDYHQPIGDAWKWLNPDSGRLNPHRDPRGAKNVATYTLPAISLAPPELSYSISYMLNKTSISTNKLYIF
jgi:hypothetical protein